MELFRFKKYYLNGAQGLIESIFKNRFNEWGGPFESRIFCF